MNLKLTKKHKNEQNWEIKSLKRVKVDEMTWKLTKTDTINKQKMQRGLRLNKLH